MYNIDPFANLFEKPHRYRCLRLIRPIHKKLSQSKHRSAEANTEQIQFGYVPPVE